MMSQMGQEAFVLSRSGYIDDFDDNWQLIKWRGQVASATRGKRGQTLLRDLRDSLLAMTDKALISGELQTSDGDVCALGSLGVKRGVDLSQLDPEEYKGIAKAFDIAEPLAREIMYMNDEWYDRETPEERYTKMLAWVESQIKPSDAK